MTKEDLKIKSEEYVYLLSKPVGSDPNTIMERLDYLSSILPTVGHYLSLSRFYQDQIINKSIEEYLSSEEKPLSATTINKYVTSAAKDYNYLVTMYEKINSSVVHQIDALRSMLSYKKNEMNL